MRTIFTNGCFHTLEHEGDIRTSLTIEHGLIVALDEAPSAKDNVVDVNGAHVYPALIDAHLHMMETIALASMGEPLCKFVDGTVEPHDLRGAEAKIRAIAERNHAKRGSLLILTNYVSAAFDEGRLPNRYELDSWASGADVWVLNIDGHSGSCSSSLLEKLDLEGLAPDGIFTGSAHDANLGKFTECLASRITPETLMHGIAHFCNECASFGIGTVCALEGNDDVERDRMGELTAFIAQRLPVDVRLFPQYMDETKLARIRPKMAASRVGGCMKWEMDGSVGSRTAAFFEPYNDGTKASPYFETDELERTLRHFANEGYQMSAHAIGDRAIDQLIDILGDLPGRHRIDHFEFPSAHAVERVCVMKPFVTVQPGFTWIDERFLHGYERFLTDRQIASQVPLSTLMDAGVPLCGSSDSPVQSVDPFLQMRGMREFPITGQSLSGYDALLTYTVNGAEMLGEKKGRLREGYDASFFLCDVDLETCAPSALEGLHATDMWLHGRPYRHLSDNMRALLRLLMASPHAI